MKVLAIPAVPILAVVLFGRSVDFHLAEIFLLYVGLVLFYFCFTVLKKRIRPKSSK